MVDTSSRWVLRVFQALVLAALICGCGRPAIVRTDGGDPGGAPDMTVQWSDVDLNNPATGTPIGLSIDPPTAVIDVENNNLNPLQLHALLARADGTTETPVQWWVDRPSLAEVDATGAFTPTGALGGDVKVTAIYQQFTAEAILSIRVHHRSNPGNVSQLDQVALRAGGPADLKVKMSYPYDGTVFPQGLAAPTFMWDGGGGNDVYRIWLQTPNADAEVFTQASPPARVTLDDKVWKQLTQSFRGGKLNLTVTRKTGGIVSVIGRQTFTIAAGQARGTVYYWSNNLGRLLRIKPGARSPDDFLQAAGIGGCSTCHVVSANGSRLVIGGDVDATTYDLKQGKPILSGKGRPWAMAALSPDGSVLVQNNAPLPGPPGGNDGAFDAATGNALPGTGLEGNKLWMPAFAPDAKFIAYVGSADHDLRAVDWDAKQKRAGIDRSLVLAGNDPNLATLSFPTVTPDHKWIVYQRGTQGSYDTRSGKGDLYLTRSANSGPEVKLSKLNGETYPFTAGERDRHYNYEPTIAPVPSGGYFWVVFTSRRTYGNLLTGGPESTKQLWLAAIDADGPKGNQDPSHPAFWLPGQDSGTLNMRGYWALDPCKNDGQTCADGSECCSGYCEGDDSGAPVCGPHHGGCVQEGNRCTIDADCCQPGGVDPEQGGVRCIGGLCDEPIPG